MKRSGRLRRWMIGVILGFVLFTFLGFVVLPPLLKKQAEKRLTVELGRAVNIGKLRLNPYELSVTVEDFDVREKKGDPFVGWKRLYVNFDALSSFSSDWVFSAIDIDGFHGAVVINSDGSFNFTDLIEKFTPAPSQAPTKPARPIRIVRLAVSGARVDFNDQSLMQPFTSVAGPLTFNLSEFRTVGQSGAPYQFQAVTEAGEKVSWRGTLAADPLFSKGEFEVMDVILKKYTPYIENRIRADVTDGKLSLRGRYEVKFAPGERVLRLDAGQVQMRDLHLVERDGGGPAFQLATLDVMDIEADAVAGKAKVGTITLAGGHVTARREKDGSINLLALLRPEVPPTPTAEPSPAAQPTKIPDISVSELSLKEFAFDLTDNAASRPVQIALGGVQLSVKDVTLNEGASMPLDLAFTWPSQGKVRVTGTVALKPEVKADLKTEVSALELLPLSPYLEEFVHARLTGGAVSTKNSVQLSFSGDKPVITFAGDVELSKFGLAGVDNQELAGVSSLTLKGIKAAHAAQDDISIAEVNVVGPFARIFMLPDRTLNLAAIVKPGPPTVKVSIPDAPNQERPSGGTEKSNATGAGPKIAIGRMVFTNGDFSFTDRSIDPHVRTSLTKFGGTLAGLSSANAGRADVDLKGSVDGVGPVAITGKLDPLGADTFVNLKFDFKNVDLLPLSPYAARYAGYELAGGKLTVDAKFLLDGKKVDATNVVTLNQFTFGAASQSKDATTLPVRLGVALLKDTEGKIIIDLPVQGRLDDPNFRIGKVVLRVVVNLLTKAAVSPFALLGSMFGGGGDELAFQEFPPGAAELQRAGIAKLETMVKALVNRPGLSIALEGGYDAAADVYELKRRKFAAEVRGRIWEMRRATDVNIAPPAELAISAEEYAAMVKQLFDAKFPPGTEFGAPVAPAPLVFVPPPPPPGFVKRIVNAVTGEERRARRATDDENSRRAADHQSAVMAVTAAGVPQEQMIGRLTEAVEVTENDLRALGVERAQQVRNYFITTGKIAPERVFLARGEAAAASKGPRVFLTLQ